MKYCSHCGNQLVDNAVICPKCGCPTDNYYGNGNTNSNQAQNDTLSTLAIIGFIFAFVQSIVGLICSIIAYKNAIADGSEKSKSFAKAGIIISAVFLAVGVFAVVMFAIFLAISAGSGIYYPDYYY